MHLIHFLSMKSNSVIKTHLHKCLYVSSFIRCGISYSNVFKILAGLEGLWSCLPSGCLIRKGWGHVQEMPRQCLWAVVKNKTLSLSTSKKLLAFQIQLQTFSVYFVVDIYSLIGFYSWNTNAVNFSHVSLCCPANHWEPPLVELCLSVLSIQWFFGTPWVGSGALRQFFHGLPPKSSFLQTWF